MYTIEAVLKKTVRTNNINTNNSENENKTCGHINDRRNTFEDEIVGRGGMKRKKMSDVIQIQAV